MKIKIDPLDGLAPPDNPLLCSTGAEIATIALVGASLVGSLMTNLSGSSKGQTFQAPAIPQPTVAPIPEYTPTNLTPTEPDIGGTTDKPTGGTPDTTTGAFGDLAKSGFSVGQPLAAGVKYVTPVKDRNTGQTSFADALSGDLSKVFRTTRREGWSNLISF